MLRRLLALTLPVVVATTIGAQAPAFAAPRKQIGKPAPIASVPGSYRTPTSPAVGRGLGGVPPVVRWPAATASDVALVAGGDLAPAADRDTQAVVAVPNTPVRLTAPSVSGKAAARLRSGAGAKLRVEVLPHGASAQHPVVLRLSPVDGAAKSGGSVRMTLDYSGFRQAYGGDWSSRLRLVSLPACALSTPDEPACRATPLSTTNDVSTRSVSASVPMSGATVALAAAAQSSDGGGDFGATALSATGTWSAGGESGDFSYSYPISTPAPIAGPAPGVALGYSSGSMDGMTAASNNQPSWAGEGFDYAPGMISRSYAGCADDGKTGIGDECWSTDNASMSLPGHAGELLQVSSTPDVWRLKADDGTRIERMTGAANGDNDGEHWKATTAEGWVYWFGLNRLPGWTSGKPETKSVFTVPVFGNNSGEPCYNATFASAWCDQASTWNLDYVEDPHGNTMSNWYTQELNHYARNVTASAVSTYVRGGHVEHIDYGTRKDGGVDSIYSAGFAPARVSFATADRCETAGATCVQGTPSNWPDVPWDQQCDSTTSCPSTFTPSFFTTKKLATITTRVWSGAGTSYRDVQRYTLNTSMRSPGDGRAKLLWLDGISHAGVEDGTTLTTPDVQFTPVSMSNRVDTSPTKNPILRMRISSIRTEFGSEVAVTYSQPECVLGTRMPANAESNAMRCFPVYWTPYGTSTPTFDWFHKYVVTGVTVTDKTGAPVSRVGMQETYQYIGAPAWHYDDNELVPAAHKTWGQWRGYQKVRKLVGAADTARIQTDTVYFRGMHGDKLPNNGSRSVQIAVDPDFGGAAINDEDWRNGQTRETITYNGVGDAAPVLSKTLSTPWEYGPTVTRTRLGVTTKAYVSSTKTSTTKLALDGSRGWMTSSVTNTFDAEAGLPDKIGRVVKVDTANDTSTTADDRCTRTTFATDPAGKILNAVAQQQVVAGSCSATPNLATDLITDVRTWYDTAAGFDKQVTKGDVRRAEQVGSIVGGNPVYVKKTEATYDDYGRVLTSTDALNRVTTTAYTPASGSQATSISVKNPKLWESVTTVNPAYGNATAMVDPNGRRTDATYDALGRTTAVWNPGRDKAAGQTPSEKYAYVVNGIAGSTSVATSVLNTGGTGYLTSYQLYDGLLRKRQTQRPAVGGGVVLTDTIYDSRGLAVQANDSYFQAGVSWGNLFTPSSPTPGRALTSYDNAGRATDVVFQADGVERWRTTTTFGGDHTNTTPPAGGTPTSVWMNALGQTTELRKYQGSTATGAYDATTYTYNKRGSTEKIKDSAGTVWSFTFDVRGRTLSTVDPDRGTTEFTYDDADQPLTVKDGRGTIRSSVYDELGRVTDLYEGAAGTGTLLVHTVYDGVVKGPLSATTRYTPDGRQYANTVTEYRAGTYQPTKTSVVVPAAEGALLAGTYLTETTYNPDGSVATVKLPAIGGAGAGSQPSETVTYGYDALGNPTTVTGLNTYVTATAYDAFGRVSATLYNDGGSKNLAQLWSYEPGTGRLLEHGVYDNDTGDVFQDVYPSYDNAGRITALKDLTNQYGAGPDDNQCFRYDYLQHLLNAWTPSNGDCSANPTNVTAAALGGPSPYWQSWTYDAMGNRKQQIDRTAAGDTTTTSTYPLATAARPHTLTSVSVQPPTGGATSNSYVYDPAGNTTDRILNGRTPQKLRWDAEGRLSSVTDTAGTSSYVYNAAGDRLIARDSNGTTLYLGGQEIRVSPANQVKTTRFYGGGAIRTSDSGLAWTVADYHGTGQLVLKASNLARTQRRTNPFGTVRGANPTWPTTRGFVGGITDPTGLTQVGARPYDADLGRFVSADPVFNSGDPQAFNGYGYANYNPVSDSDPSGLSHDNGGSNNGSNLISVRYWNDGKHYYRTMKFWAVVCISRGGCVGSSGEWALAVITWQQMLEKVPHRLYPTREYTTTIKTHQPKVECPVPPPPPPPPPSCSFFDFKCGYKHPGWWWQGNKGWVEAGVMVAGIGLCAFTAGAGCYIAGAIGAGISMADRTYEFVNSGAYNDGWMAWGGYGLGMGIDALGFIPGGKAASRGAEAAGERMVRCAKPHSFAPDTPVLLADDTTKPISDIQLGDQVKATDPLTGEDAAEPVTALHVNRDTDLADVTVAGPAGTSVLHTTQHHPFWNETRQEWTDAADLRVGDRLRTTDRTGVLVVAALVVFQGRQEMRDLTVDRIHTYYVIAGTIPVLVHNCDISMNEALDRAAAHVGDNPTSRISGSGGVQFESVTIDAAGNTVRRIARFDINPNSAHVQGRGPHLNLETQINGQTVRSGPLADPHTDIDSSTIIPGDY